MEKPLLNQLHLEHFNRREEDEGREEREPLCPCIYILSIQ